MTKKYAWCKGFVDGYENEARKHHIYEKNFKQGVKDEYKQRAYNDGVKYEKNRLKNTHTSDTVLDTKSYDWLSVPENKFHIIPQSIDSSDPERTVLHNLRKLVGLPELELDNKIWHNVLNTLHHKSVIRTTKVMKSSPIICFPDDSWIPLSTYFNTIKEFAKAGKPNPYKKNERL